MKQEPGKKRECASWGTFEFTLNLWVVLKQTTNNKHPSPKPIETMLSEEAGIMTWLFWRLSRFTNPEDTGT